MQYQKSLCCLLILSSLYTQTLFSVHTKKIIEAQKCSICLEKLPKHQHHKITLPCDHTFCTPCMWQWGNRSCECPLCRNKAPVIISRDHIIALSTEKIKTLMEHGTGLSIRPKDFKKLDAASIRKIILLCNGDIQLPSQTNIESTILETPQPHTISQETQAHLHNNNRFNHRHFALMVFIPLFLVNGYILFYPDSFIGIQAAKLYTMLAMIGCWVIICNADKL